MDKEPLSYAQTELFAETRSEKQGEVELRNPCRSHEANRDGRQAGRQADTGQGSDTAGRVSVSRLPDARKWREV